MKKTLFLFLTTTCYFFCNAQHVVNLKNGDKMNGNVKSLKDGVVTLQFKGNDIKLEVAEINSIVFDPSSGLTSTTNNVTYKEKEVGEKSITSGSYLVKYKVADRSIAKTPQISNLTQEKGTVVVDITIDKYGHVVKAVPGGTGSTTNSEYLKTKAKQAAESAIFDNVPTAPLEQKGYMIISF